MKNKTFFFLTLSLLLPNLYAAEDVGEFIFHHIGNSSKWHPIPFLPGIPLPANFYIGPVNLGITLHVLMILVGALTIVTVLRVSVRRAELMPTSRIGHAIEAIVIYLRDELVIQNLGKNEGTKWLPFFLTLFFFLLTLNLIGLIPGMSKVTANINFTGAMAFIVFIAFNTAGIIKNGPVHYFINLIPKGIPWPVTIILAPIEFLGLLIKPFALAIRLFANMTSGHIVILSLLSLISILKSTLVVNGIVISGSILFSLFIYLIEIMVAFLQAYVFTLLSTLYVGMAIHQEH